MIARHFGRSAAAAFHLGLAAWAALAATPAAAQVGKPVFKSEILSLEREGGHTGGVISSNGNPILVPYREDHGRAVVGGDMVIGTHAEMKQRLEQYQSLRAAPVHAAGAQTLAAAPAAEAKAVALAPAATLRMLGWRTMGDLWPTRVIRYRIDASIPEGPRRTTLLAAVRRWNAQSALRLRPAGDRQPGNGQTILLFVDHEDPDEAFACASWVGHHPDADGYQRIWLNPGCEVGNVMHEIGHAAGLEHEHQRTDRETLLALSEAFPEQDGNYAEIDGRDSAASGHDVCSVMHYSPDTTDPAWFTLTEEGERAFTTCSRRLPQDCRVVGQRCRLSPVDRLTLAALYPRRR